MSNLNNLFEQLLLVVKEEVHYEDLLEVLADLQIIETENQLINDRYKNAF